jgi:hypothetical protein
MKERLQVCPSCSRHVRSRETACPHCGVSPGAGGWRSSERRYVFVRRALTVGAALSGMVGGSCLSENTDVQGTCTMSPDSNDCTTHNCYCGSGGICSDAGVCVSCNCESDQHCNSAGQCEMSFHTCYGAPSLLS